MIPPKEFIRKIHPFSFLSEDDLDIIVSGLEVDLFEKGKTIYKKGQTSENVYVIFSGLVGLFDDEAPIDYLSRGEIFGLMSLYGNLLNATAKAMEDTVCYAVAHRQFKIIFDSNERFASFFSTLLNRRLRSFKTIASDKKILEEALFVLELEKIIYKNPVVCSPEMTIAGAAFEMDKNSVSSIVIVDTNAMPIGILTHKDLRKVLISGDRLDPVTEFMSSPVKTINVQATIFEAYSKMIDAGIDHLVVTKNDKVFGIITRKDIQIHLEPSFSIVKLFRKVHKAASIEELKTAFEGLMVSVSKIAMTGPNFFDLTRMLCSVHDAVVYKVIQILIDKHAPARFLWIHMGSSGRKEEIIATDQDNALIYLGDNPAALAKNINESLAKIGYPTCFGNYMASNSLWNQPLPVWKEYFNQWFSDPIPDHLRYLSVFLDMRPLYGETALYNELLESIKAAVKAEAIKLMAEDTIEIRPPLGIFGILGLHKGVDLKTYGIFPIVNGARVLAVDSGVWGITNTKERLEALSANMTISNEMCHDLIESYGFLQDLRLRHHARAVLNKSQANNLITTKELSNVDLLILKESLKIVSEFQKFLMKKYGVSRTVIYSQL
ncbi:MAG TPA: putative nucleotidyltransferase substrate binding domain-containing protein [Thermodesulfovibrionales bacterium]|nr:putative nucleotidyltransferase substrate binding domain-containing protein [Thermodesulfovibrionales bacterium]